MDIHEILNKTQKKSEQIKIVRKPPSIATEDRPYSTDEIELAQKIESLIDNKPTTNRQQIDNKTGNKPITNWQQTGNKNSLKIQNRQQIDNKSTTKPTTEVATNRQQTDNKLATNWQQKYHFSSLVGLQRKLIIYIYKECKNSRSKITEAITLEHISYSLKCSNGCAKTTLQRLESKGCIIRKEFKIGRGGWSKYELPEEIYREVIISETDNKPITNRQQIDNKLATKPATESTTSLLSSSSNLIKTTTTNESNFEQNLNNFEKWKKVDLSPLTEIGFLQTHLFQIAKQNLIAPEVVQESIHAFAFDLTKNDKAKSLKKMPLDFFMGILRNGDLYSPPPNYKSPKELALEAFIEKQNHIKKLEEEAMNIAFQNWVSKLTPDEKNRIIPEETKKMGVSGLMNQAIRSHFKENVWSSIREEIMLQKMNTH